MSHLMAIALISLLSGASDPVPQVPFQITTLSPLVLDRGREAPMLLTVMADSISKLRIVHSTLRDASTGTLLLSSQVLLCDNPVHGCTTPVSLSKGSHQLYLVVSDSFAAHGEFKGSLYLQVAEKPDPTTIELTVYGSDGGATLLGTTLIVVGVLLSILMTAWLRQTGSRLDALAPAAEVASHLDKLEPRLFSTGASISFNFPVIHARILGLRNDLAEAALDARGFLPHQLRSPFGGEPDSTAYRTYLSERSEQIAALTVIVERGLDALGRATKLSPTHQAITLAAEEIDQLGGSARLTAEATAAVAQVIAKMDAALQPAGGQAMVQGGLSGPVTRSTLEIRSQQARIVLAAWGILALVTVVAGVVILIVSNFGFGTPLDYAKCFFWGLGVQTAGQQLQQLTPGGIATSLKLSLPA